MFKLGVQKGMTLENAKSDMVWRLKGQGHRVNRSILHTRKAIHRHSLGGVTSRRRGIELYECLLVLLTFMKNYIDFLLYIGVSYALYRVPSL